MAAWRYEISLLLFNALETLIRTVEEKFHFSARSSIISYILLINRPGPTFI